MDIEFAHFLDLTTLALGEALQGGLTKLGFLYEN